MNKGIETPFPKREVCKNCASKPCQWFLKTYNEPGKFMIVSPSEFISIPCFTPSFVKEEEETEAKALTDDMEVVEGKVDVTNPRWQQKDEKRKSSSPDMVKVGDAIILLADVKNLADGAAVSFDIFDVSGDSPFRVATVDGKNESGVGKGEWTVDDPNKAGDNLKLEFEAIAKSKASVRTKIPLVSPTIFSFSV